MSDLPFRVMTTKGLLAREPTSILVATHAALKAMLVFRFFMEDLATRKEYFGHELRIAPDVFMAYAMAYAAVERTRLPVVILLAPEEE